MTHRIPTLLTILFRGARLAIFAALIFLGPRIASAQPRCSVLDGTYAFTFSGTLPFAGPPAILAPYGGVGMQPFDGAGNFFATESATFPGFVFRSSRFSGTYTLNPDCTGTMTARFPDGSTGKQDFVVANAGKTIYAVGVDAAPPGSSLMTTFSKLTPAQ